MSGMTKEEFSRLVLQYEKLVYTICFQLTRDAAAAEDLAQETFLSAYLHKEKLPLGYERQWLGRIAANKAKDHLQSAWKRHAVLPGDEAMPPGKAPAAEETALQRSGAAEIRSAIEKLRSPMDPYAGYVCWKRNRRRRRLWPWEGRSKLFTPSWPGKGIAEGDLGKEWGIWTYFVTMDT